MAIPLAAQSPHPRLGLNPALLHQFDALKASNDPTWTNFADWLTRKKAGWTGYTYIGSDEDGYLLGYVTTHDRALFDLAWASISKNIYAPDGSLRKLYDPVCGRALYCDAHEAAYKGGGVATLIAKLYDYGYDALSDQQRADILAWLNAATVQFAANANSTTYFRNDGAITTRALNAIYLATLGENPNGDAISAAWHAAWAEQVRALRLMSDGGGMGEGNGYGAITMATLVDLANSTFYATGEDLFASSPAFKARLAYDAFSTYPKRLFDLNDPWYSGANPTSEPASIAGDSVRQSGWVTLSLLPAGRMLSRHFPGTEEAGIWNWVFRQPGSNTMPDPWMALYTYSPPPALTKPTRLSWYAPGTGMVYVRQNWDSQDATWIASWAGPHFDLHQHLDQGAFGLFKRRDLLPGQTGDYDFSTMGSPHWIQYYSRTVATNNLLIGDPTEQFYGFWGWNGCGGGSHSLFPLPDGPGGACIANDGGQRSMVPHSMSIFGVGDYLKARGIYDVAQVLNFADDGDVVRWTMDTTNAYTSAANTTATADDGSPFVSSNKPKVSEVKRRYAYIRAADVLIVGDTVDAISPTFEKSAVFHSLAKLDILDGTKAEISPAGESLYTAATTAKITLDETHPNSKGQLTADYRLGYAAAFVQSVFPVGAQLRVIGGREPSDTEHQAQGQTDPTLKQARHFHTHVKDFWVKDYSEGVQPDHKSANWAPIYPTDRSDTFASMVGGYGVARVHVQPTVAQKRDYFLTVVQPSLDATAAPLKTTRLETDAGFGVSFTSAGRAYTVSFPKQGDSPPVVMSLDPTVPTAPATSGTPTTTIPTPPIVPPIALPPTGIGLTPDQRAALAAAVKAAVEALAVAQGLLR